MDAHTHAFTITLQQIDTGMTQLLIHKGQSRPIWFPIIILCLSEESEGNELGYMPILSS